MAATAQDLTKLLDELAEAYDIHPLDKAMMEDLVFEIRNEYLNEFIATLQQRLARAVDKRINGVYVRWPSKSDEWQDGYVMALSEFNFDVEY